MKVNRGQIERALDQPGTDIRLFLLYGPDESGSAALAERLARAMGPEAERIDLEGTAVGRDPALLADEAAAFSLFGGARYVRLRAAGDECADAVAALLDAPAAGNPVIALTGALKPSSRLLKLALAAPLAMAFASYAPEGADAARLAISIGRDLGLRIAPDIARRLVESTGGDRALLTREIEKLALYVDAAPDRPGEAGHDALDAVGVDNGDTDLSRLVDTVLSGAPAAAGAEIDRLGTANALSPQAARGLLRRVALLAQLRADVERGRAPEDVVEAAGKTIFWKEKPAVARQLRLWSATDLVEVHGRLLAVERQLKSSQTAGPVVAAAELLAIARAGARRRQA
ncbi:DNA polymerase III subunit delta [Sphingomonas flavalba]|uniref:DNA polymerase III subunit delta n=1 Tax=Sphingomonas flavalba TaxID=2559804 RepID=UPI00109DDD2C|nr:DNA polymerase III subunit delta [Sphingomonas flavalba]